MVQLGCPVASCRRVTLICIHINEHLASSPVFFLHLNMEVTAYPNTLMNLSSPPWACEWVVIHQPFTVFAFNGHCIVYGLHEVFYHLFSLGWELQVFLHGSFFTVGSCIPALLGSTCLAFRSPSFAESLVLRSAKLYSPSIQYHSFCTSLLIILTESA